MKNALICLERLDIGGVETFTIAQVKEYARRGIKCTVLCKEGILSKKIKDEKNVQIIDFEYKIQNKIELDKIEEIEKIIKKNKIDFVVIHQYPCIPYLLPLLIKHNIPYISYLHNIVEGTYDWFEKKYPMYQVLFKTFFENAQVIVAIADKVKQEHKIKYNLPDSKYKVVSNSLDFEEYDSIKRKPNLKKLTSFMIIGRLAKEKEKSIISGINFFNYYKEKINDKATLKIVGGGELFDSLKEKYENESIIFKGPVSNVLEELETSDAVLGVDRCILETIAAKRVAIISSYDGNVRLISKDIIEKEIKENFSGKTLEDKSKEIEKYTEEDLQDIIENNYKVIEEKLSIKNSIITDIKKEDYEIDFYEFYKLFAKEQDRVQSLLDENYNLYLKLEEYSKYLRIFRKLKNVITLKK